MITGTAGRDREQEVREYLGEERRGHERVYSAGRCSRCNELATIDVQVQMCDECCVETLRRE